MSNEIPKKQNMEENLRLLRAQRRIYARAKRLLALQMILTLALPVGFAVLVIFWSDLKALTAVIALAAVIVDTALLDRLQKDIRRLGAKIQEMFDCAVLDLPWDYFTVGDEPEPENIHEAAEAHGTNDDEALKNWYPLAAGTMPLYVGRIICQRTNLFYDAKLRRYVGKSTLTLVLGVTAILSFVGVALKLPLDVFILTVVAPVVPVIVWGTREFYRQRDAADASDRLRKQAEELWKRLLTETCHETECAEQSRLFQNGIFERRVSAPVVFGWIYKRLRPKLEPQMDAGAEAMVKAFNDRRT